MVVMSKPATPTISPENLAEINEHLRPLDPPQILEWALAHLPQLYQTTAFGLTGVVAIDMLSKIPPGPTGQPPLIFIDTLYHFPETYALVAEVEKRYGLKVNVFKPNGCENVADFENKWGERLWARDEDTYDFAVKVRRVCLRCTGGSDDAGRARSASLSGIECRCNYHWSTCIAGC